MASLAEDSFAADFDAGKRAAPRLPLSLPGTLIATGGNHDCIISNLSRTGVLLALREPLRVGSDGFLRCGPIDHFVIVQRAGIGLNAVTFEIPVSNVFVSQVRRYQEELGERELNELRGRARDWTGL